MAARKRLSLDEILGTSDEPSAMPGDPILPKRSELAEATQRVLDGLTPRERELLEKRFAKKSSS